MKYEDVKTPEELLEFMDQNIKYGYLGKNGRIFHIDDNDFNEKWYDEYILESNKNILSTMLGNCWDQVEFERDWFLNHNYEVITVFEMVKLNYDNNYPTHSFLTYKDEKGNWNWFEHSDFNNRGIHSFLSFDELMKYQYNCYVKFLKTFNIKETELKQIIVTKFNKPKDNITAKEYLDYVTSQESLNIKST